VTTGFSQKEPARVVVLPVIQKNCAMIMVFVVQTAGEDANVIMDGTALLTAANVTLWSYVGAMESVMAMMIRSVNAPIARRVVAMKDGEVFYVMCPVHEMRMEGLAVAKTPEHVMNRVNVCVLLGLHLITGSVLILMSANKKMTAMMGKATVLTSVATTPVHAKLAIVVVAEKILA